MRTDILEFGAATSGGALSAFQEQLYDLLHQCAISAGIIVEFLQAQSTDDAKLSIRDMLQDMGENPTIFFSTLTLAQEAYPQNTRMTLLNTKMNVVFGVLEELAEQTSTTAHIDAKITSSLSQFSKGNPSLRSDRVFARSYNHSFE